MSHPESSPVPASPQTPSAPASASTPASARLSAGPWRAELAPHGIADIRHDGVPLVPRLFFSVRDPQWGTPRLVWHWLDERPAPAPTATATARTTTGPGVTDAPTSRRFTAAVDGVPLRIEGELTADHELLALDVTATAVEAVALGRIGPAVLHDPSPHGAVLRTDGVPRVQAAPDDIAPLPLATGYTRMSWGPLELRLVGGEFELEDQRNWADATLKSYTPPLAAPQPIELAAGEVRSWRVELRVDPSATDASTTGGSASESGTAEPRTTGLSTDASEPAPSAPLRRPALGLSHQGGPVPEAAVEPLRALRPAYLHLLAELTDPDWQATLRSDLDAARQLGIPAVVTAAVPAEGRAAALTRLAETLAGVADTVLVFDQGRPGTSPELAEAARAAFAGLPIAVGGGSRGHFASLNRAGSVPSGLDPVALAIAAAAHDDDLRALSTSPESFAAIGRGLRRLAGDRALLIGPVGLRPSFDPWGGGSPAASARDWADELPVRAAAFGADWTLAAYAALLPLGAARVTIAGTLGPRGVGELRGAEFVPHPLAAAIRRLTATASDEL